MKSVQQTLVEIILRDPGKASLTISTLSNFNGLFHSLFWIKPKWSAVVKGLKPIPLSNASSMHIFKMFQTINHFNTKQLQWTLPFSVLDQTKVVCSVERIKTLRGWWSL